jgi:hypothetical protein|tara:strand:+ start:217 stop:342 length:126 start_codon:yes stop_codon:yes gene_type:complete
MVKKYKKTKKPNIRRLSGAVVPGIEITGYKNKKPKRRAPGK